jgi:cytochrome b pre-mRNA-processing protein 3
LSFLSRIFGNPARERARLRPLYDSIVREARQPAWYRDGKVPDTLEGRFDMVSTMLALVLLRLEREGEAMTPQTILLTELFIDDMDGTLRQIGIGDIIVGKHVGKIMGALGGRLGAFRDGLSGGADLAEAVRRNIFRDEPPSAEAVDFVSAQVKGMHEALGAIPVADVLRGEIGR